MENPENPFSRIVRPLNAKHTVRAIIAFILTEAGELLRHEDGDTEEIKILKKKISAKRAKVTAELAAAEKEDGDQEPENQGDDLAGKAD